MTNLNLVRPGFRLTGSGAGAPAVLVREGHRLFERTKLFRTNENFREKSVVQKKKRTMDERNGSK